jgi:hypothetical protein
MFDYQAGEKFKLTLIMVGFAGLMAGMLFTMILMPSSEPPSRRKQAQMSEDNGRHPGIRDAGNAYSAAQSRASRYLHPEDDPAAQAATPGAPGTPPQAAAAPTGPATDPTVATTFLEQWLPVAWDPSAGTAKNSQEKAILYMTPECATAYRQNIWTSDLSKQIEDSGLQSTFQPRKVAASQTQPDGSVVIFVEGEQVLQVPGKESQTRPVKLEYLVRTTSDGLRIAGISEGGAHG